MTVGAVGKTPLSAGLGDACSHALNVRHIQNAQVGREPPLELLGGYEPAAQKRFTEVAAVVPLVLEGLAYVVFVDLAERLISI